MTELQLFGAPWPAEPPVKARPRVKDHALETARTATRRARERAVGGGWSPPVSQPVRTVEPMPRGGRRAEVEPAHGTRARYNNRRYLCRCAACRGANNAYMARYRSEAAPEGVRLRRAITTIRPDQRLL